MSLQAARVFDLDRDQLLLPQLVQIHHDCITNDFTMSTFLPPLKTDDMTAYWHDLLREAKEGSRFIIVQCTEQGDRQEVAGVVTLNMPFSETGPFRSEVHKLLVSPKHRYKGIARSLMMKLEEVARQHDKWLVMLDTTVGSGAAILYGKLGYKQVGIIPNYGFSPKDGSMYDEIFFYKDLREPGAEHKPR